jgi:hypothetical protein
VKGKKEHKSSELAEARKGGTPQPPEIFFPPLFHHLFILFHYFAHGALALFFKMLNGTGIKIFTGM